jgi:hypothetical protein
MGTGRIAPPAGRENIDLHQMVPSSSSYDEISIAEEGFMARCPTGIQLGLLLAVLAGGAQAAGVATDKGAGEVVYIAGGIGNAEQVQLAAREKEFNLKVVFTLIEGNYLADVNVAVTDAKGRKVIEHLAGGPLFLAALPAGEYQVAATFRGKTVNRKIRVAANRLRTEYFRWPANRDEDLPVSRWLDKD